MIRKVHIDLLSSEFLSENSNLKNNLRDAKAENNELLAENTNLRNNLREAKTEINELKATLEELKEQMKNTKNMPQVQFDN